ncbi:mitofilin [Schizosaccharomyces japonicus yFS275]|uniref:MICOS complex subunit MIC60 n=1 Tax=Schizosaccharomyces japonicus (strain yFS275 / FY16936) TaxID=402676 RepID=B6JZI8_SCHJY|nr:mitofilin [Schizosaccharomyces japonicus yFS275]EEB06956.1 mitofilin [Schizosaccharomyces japonicus yFS275]
MIRPRFSCNKGAVWRLNIQRRPVSQLLRPSRFGEFCNCTVYSIQTRFNSTNSRSSYTAPSHTSNSASSGRKKGSFGWKKIISLTIILGATGYSVGVWYAFKDRHFYDFFSNYFPYGKRLLSAIEDSDFGRKYLNAGLVLVRTVPLPPSAKAKEEESISVQIANTLADMGKTEEKGESRHFKLTHLVPPGDSFVQPAIDIGSDLETGVSVTRMPPVVETLNKAQVAEFNDTKEELGKTSSRIQALEEELQLLKASQEELLEVKKEECEASYKQRLEQAEHEYDELWTKSFDKERERLQNLYKSRLQLELTKSMNIFEEKLQNELREQALELERLNAMKVTMMVETERQGRLGKLQQVQEGLEKVQQLAFASVARAQQLDQAAKLATAIDLLSNDSVHSKHEALKYISGLHWNDPLVQKSVAILQNTFSRGGIPSLAEIHSRFDVLSDELSRTVHVQPNTGLLSHLFHTLLFRLPVIENQVSKNSSVTGVLLRARSALHANNLEAAVYELSQLDPWHRALTKDWVSTCRQRLELQQSLEILMAVSALRACTTSAA